MAIAFGSPGAEPCTAEVWIFLSPSALVARERFSIDTFFPFVGTPILIKQTFLGIAYNFIELVLREKYRALVCFHAILNQLQCSLSCFFFA